MTACVDNKEKKGGAAKAVSATLAGVLAVGMVPAVAFATPDDGTEAEGEISLLNLKEDEAFEAGKTIEAVDAEGTTVTSFADVEYAFDGNAHYLTPTKFVPDGQTAETAIDLTTAADGEYTIQYASAKYDSATEAWVYDSAVGFNTTDPEQVVKPGTYAVNIYKGPAADSQYPVAAATIVFTITSVSIEDATVYEVGSNSADVSDDTFEYTGDSQYFGSAVANLNVELNGKPLAYGEDKDYVIEAYYKPNGEKTTNAADVKTPGKYSIDIAGKGAYAGQKATIDFTIEPLNLSEASIELGFTGSNFDGRTMPTISKINGKTWPSGAINELTVSCGKNLDGSLGEYTFAIAPAANQTTTAYYAGAATVTAVHYQTEAAFKYNGASLSDGQKFDVDYSDKAQNDAFDFGELEVLDAKGRDLPYTITVKDAKGNVVDNSSVTKAGTWTVTVSVDYATAGNYNYGGSRTFTVEVTSGEVDASADVIVLQDGQVVSSVKAYYDGTDVLDDVQVVVRNEDGETLSEGDDYTVEYLDANNDPVTEMINAGTYKIVVKGAGYSLNTADNTDVIAVEIEAAQADTLRVANTTVERDQHDVVAYTGDEIPLSIEYTNADAVDQATGKQIWTALPADAYRIVTLQWFDEDYGEDGGWRKVDSIENPGFYNIVIQDATGSSAIAKNYDVAELNIGASTFVDPATDPAKELEFGVTDGYFYVSNDRVFSDVAEGQWYTDYVYTAADLGYMTGYDNTTLFRPMSTLSRGETATMLFKMAGGVNDWGLSVTDFPFSDMGTHEFYTTPISWAEGAEIITGYDDTGLFEPNQAVTREALCTMLYRYAQATNQVGTVPADVDAVLAAYPDGESVSSWAREAVAWAIENGIFGGDTTLRPTDTTARAEAAKMVTVLQPGGILADMF